MLLPYAGAEWASRRVDLLIDHTHFQILLESPAWPLTSFFPAESPLSFSYILTFIRSGLDVDRRCGVMSYINLG